MKTLRVSSPTFDNNGFIPSRYTCDGKNVNPPLEIDNIPEETESLALIVDDPDAPMGTWDHWIVWNIRPVKRIEEDQVPGTEGLNDFNKHSYGGPCPPSGTHRYFFKVYALDNTLELNQDSRKKDLEKAMEPHIIGKGVIIGQYKRN
jgi:Raf kinase inhibitor-like YbhB/YbcL family protein